jgi:hypothetical protein
VPLTNQQANDLKLSIDGYAFPPVYFDFVANAQVNAGNMYNLETAISGLLLSPCLQQVQYGLANVIYWGNANAGYQAYRVNKFMNNITNQQLQRFQALVAGGEIPTLQNIRQIRMPQFSGISFVSKIIAFIDPTNYCVLDLLLCRLRNIPGNKALHGLTVTTQIGVTCNNSAAYYAWCRECREINDQYFRGIYRAVDIERGFFNFIQNGSLEYAQKMYIAA